MFAWLVGNVDVPAAAVLVAMFIGIGIVSMVGIAQHMSERAYQVKMRELENSDVQAERNVALQHDIELGKIASNREIEFKRIDTNMITSHSRDEDSS